MTDTIGTRITKLREQKGKQTQQQLADALGVSRELVKAWEKGSRKVQTDDLIKLAEHFDVTTDYLLCLTTVQKETPSLRSAVEYTGLSERAVLAIASATFAFDRYYDRYDKEISKAEYDRLNSPDVNHLLDLYTVAVLDDFLRDGEEGFWRALTEIKRLTGVVEDFEAEFAISEVDSPFICMENALLANQLYRELRYSLFELSEEAKSCADELYGYSDSLKKITDLKSRMFSLVSDKDSPQSGLEHDHAG